MLFEHDDAVRSTTRRARIVKVDDDGTQQLVDLKGLKNEEPKKIYRVVDFGRFAVPPKDTEGLLMQMGGRSDRSVWLDGGHKDYRPKKRPAGSSGLFDQYGDLLQIDKDNFALTHARKVTINLGKGYDAKDAGDYSGPAVSIVFDGNAMTLTMGSSVVKLETGKITLTSPKVVVDSPDVNLGGEGGQYVKRCDDSCATRVKAV